MPSFKFSERHGRLDFRALSRLTLDEIQQQGAANALQPLLSNVVFSLVHPEDLAVQSDESVCRLVRFSQLALEYMMHVQVTLHGAVEESGRESLALRASEAAARGEAEEARLQLKAAQRQLRAQAQLLSDMRALIAAKGLGMGGLAVVPTGLGEPSGSHAAGAGPPTSVVFKCAACPKAFISLEHLDGHVARRHGGLLPPPPHAIIRSARVSQSHPVAGASASASAASASPGPKEALADAGVNTSLQAGGADEVPASSSSPPAASAAVAAAAVQQEDGAAAAAASALCSSEALLARMSAEHGAVVCSLRTKIEDLEATMAWHAASVGASAASAALNASMRTARGPLPRREAGASLEASRAGELEEEGGGDGAWGGGLGAQLAASSALPTSPALKALRTSRSQVTPVHRVILGAVGDSPAPSPPPASAKGSGASSSTLSSLQGAENAAPPAPPPTSAAAAAAAAAAATPVTPAAAPFSLSYMWTRLPEEQGTAQAWLDLQPPGLSDALRALACCASARAPNPLLPPSWAAVLPWGTAVSDTVPRRVRIPPSWTLHILPRASVTAAVAPVGGSSSGGGAAGSQPPPPPLPTSFSVPVTGVTRGMGIGEVYKELEGRMGDICERVKTWVREEGGATEGGEEEGAAWESLELTSWWVESFHGKRFAGDSKTVEELNLFLFPPVLRVCFQGKRGAQRAALPPSAPPSTAGEAQVLEPPPAHATPEASPAPALAALEGDLGGSSPQPEQSPLAPLAAKDIGLLASPDTSQLPGDMSTVLRESAALQAAASTDAVAEEEGGEAAVVEGEEEEEEEEEEEGEGEGEEEEGQAQPALQPPASESGGIEESGQQQPLQDAAATAAAAPSSPGASRKGKSSRAFSAPPSTMLFSPLPGTPNARLEHLRRIIRKGMANVFGALLGQAPLPTLERVSSHRFPSLLVAAAPPAAQGGLTGGGGSGGEEAGSGGGGGGGGEGASASGHPRNVIVFPPVGGATLIVEEVSADFEEGGGDSSEAAAAPAPAPAAPSSSGGDETTCTSTEEEGSSSELSGSASGSSFQGATSVVFSALEGCGGNARTGRGSSASSVGDSGGGTPFSPTDSVASSSAEYLGAAGEGGAYGSASSSSSGGGGGRRRGSARQRQQLETPLSNLSSIGDEPGEQDEQEEEEEEEGEESSSSEDGHLPLSDADGSLSSTALGELAADGYEASAAALAAAVATKEQPSSQRTKVALLPAASPAASKILGDSTLASSLTSSSSSSSSSTSGGEGSEISEVSSGLLQHLVAPPSASGAAATVNNSAPGPAEAATPAADASLLLLQLSTSHVLDKSDGVGGEGGQHSEGAGESSPAPLEAAAAAAATTSSAPAPASVSSQALLAASSDPRPTSGRVGENLPAASAPLPAASLSHESGSSSSLTPGNGGVEAHVESAEEPCAAGEPGKREKASLPEEDDEDEEEDEKRGARLQASARGGEEQDSSSEDLPGGVTRGRGGSLGGGGIAEGSGSRPKSAGRPGSAGRPKSAGRGRNW
jgi:hypothetical protein